VPIVHGDLPGPDISTLEYAKSAPSAGGAWQVQADRIVVRGGWLRFHDLAVQGGDALRASIRRFEIGDIDIDASIVSTADEVAALEKRKLGVKPASANDAELCIQLGSIGAGSCSSNES
jgi:hypothetical protein